MRRFIPLVSFALLMLPAVALAQSTAAASHWIGLWASPAVLLAGLVALGLGAGLNAPGWKRLGMALWMITVTFAGSAAVFALSYAAKGPAWQLPALALASGAFAVAAERSRKQLSEEND
jgi:hypothetical protein